MAANLTDTFWSWETIVAKMDEVAPKAGRPESYKKAVGEVILNEQEPHND